MNNKVESRHPQEVAFERIMEHHAKIWKKGDGYCPICGEWIGTLMMNYPLGPATMIHNSHGGI